MARAAQIRKTQIQTRRGLHNSLSHIIYMCGVELMTCVRSNDGDLQHIGGRNDGKSRAEYARIYEVVVENCCIFPRSDRPSGTRHRLEMTLTRCH